MLHYDASTSDDGGIAWFKDKRCKISYQWAIRDNGEVVAIAPENRRAYHAGVCKPSTSQLSYTDANSAFLGIAITATSGDTVTSVQMSALVDLCKRLFVKHGWPLTETWRITGHSAECWPRGRKSDPEGQGPVKVLDPNRVREALAA